MDETLKIVEFIINNNIYVVVLFFVIFLFRNPKELFNALDSWNSSKIKTLESALKSASVKGSSRKLIEEKLEQRYFYLSTGLDAEKDLREKILQVYKNCSGSLGFRHFVRARDHYKYENSTLSIQWGIYKNSLLYLNFITGSIFALISLIMFTVGISLLISSASVQVSLYGSLPAAIIIVITAIVSLKSWISLFSTNLVRKEIEAFYKSNASEYNQCNISESRF